MPTSGKAGDKQLSTKLKALHGAMMSIVSVMNRPQRDQVLINAAGIRLDRALFPLLVGIERRGPIGVVELADRIGRDYTTVSRQVGRLESLGLVKRRANPLDRRVREAVISAKGKTMTDRIDAARERIGHAVFETWPQDDIDDLVRLMCKLAEALEQEPPVGS